MIRSSTIQLLRFHFSFFLMPVYWFALSQVPDADVQNSVLIFVILHLLIYPASNGYNSYMDRDTSSIGGVKNPQMPTRQLFYATIVLDLLGLLLSAFVGTWFFMGILAFIAASKAYSYRGIRLKKYPVLGYLTVIIFQGALVFFLVTHGSSQSHPLHVSLIGMITASLLVGGFYPLTQIYQHMQDKEDGVVTLSYQLGYRGTFLFTAIVYAVAMSCLAFFLYQKDGFYKFGLMQIFLLPVLVYFTWWFLKVYKNTAEANFSNTMRMNIIASLCTNAAFIFLSVIEKY
ncbi:MAG TPA: UbiA family prenyltransferase [Ferruginibacter sp.]|nr:UbiA family prenyltransferase [Ferruginibacter sp.]